jgi:hypothetical protein
VSDGPSLNERRRPVASTGGYTAPPVWVPDPTNDERRERGVYYTPPALAGFAVETMARHLPDGPLAVVDPACGAGSFLASAQMQWPRAHLFGLELSLAAAEECRRRVPGATVLSGDALRGDLDRLLAKVPAQAFELWIGNPPYNGTSPALRDKRLYAVLQRLMPADLPRGTSLRDDYAFFLLLARERLSKKAGALAFITSATLIDAFLYAPVRRALLDALCLREVIELGVGAFEQTRVRTCVTVWTSSVHRGHARFRARAESGPFRPEQVGPPTRFAPAAPEWLLRPPSSEADALEGQWRARGEPLSRLLPVSLPGLKTRFDTLLVDDNPRRLTQRIRELLRLPPGVSLELRAFAERWAIPPSCWDKLVALTRAVHDEQVRFNRSCIRPFFRYAGARHRGRIPESARAWCYLERHLIPRGDHRFRGTYDPHRCSTKLVFNTRELPLSAAVLTEAGCVHDHRHARFAPLLVPEPIRREGLRAAGRSDGGPEVPNLSERGRAWAERLGGPAAAYRAIADFINSEAVQRVWAPAYGASRELCVPLDET